MKRTVLLLLCVCILLLSSGCLRKDPDTDTQAPLGDSSEKEITPQEKIAKWLEENFSFSFFYKFTSLSYGSIELSIEQVFAKDGSFSMISTWRESYLAEGLDNEEISKFYYRFEGEQLVCYSQSGDSAPARVELTHAQKIEMERSEAKVTGQEGIFPSYIKNFALAEEKSEEGLLAYSFELPVKDVLEDNGIMLHSYIGNVMSLSKAEDSVLQDVDIICNIVVDKQNYRPVSISYDFNELKPYVLSEGDFSFEEALGGNCLEMGFEFNYDLEETVPVPKELLSSFADI